MTAVVLAEPLTAEWFEARRKGIGASEIAAIMGISPWESPFSIFWRKVNGWEQEPSPEMSAGQRLEPVIAEWWLDECDPLDNLTTNRGQLVAHPERPWQMATPDQTVHLRCLTCEPFAPDWYGCSDCQNTLLGSPPLAVLEVKYVAMSWDGWGEPDSDDVPVHYRAQVLWQCDVVDVQDWYLAALGPGGFRQYHGRRDDADLAVMREYGRRFMARIANNDPPPIDGHAATLATVKRLHPDLDDDEVEVDSRIANHYRRACEMDRKAGALKKRYEALLRAEMGRAKRATSGGQFVASRSVYEVAEHTVKAHTVDRLNPPRTKKEPS